MYTLTLCMLRIQIVGVLCLMFEWHGNNCSFLFFHSLLCKAHFWIREALKCARLLSVEFFFYVIFCLLASLHFHAHVPARRWQRGPGARQLPLAIVWPSARREEAACSFFQQQRGNTCFAFCVGLVSLGSVFAWVTAGIAFLMLRSCIHLFVDSVRHYLLEQK